MRCRWGARPPVATTLDAYTTIIATRLAAYPPLSAVRLLAEIRAAGYTGGHSQLKALVRRLRPAPGPEPVIRFETPAGHHTPVDFAQFRFPWGVRHALLVVDALFVNAAFSTSGATSQSVDTDGIRYSRIVDPKTGLGLTTHSTFHVRAPDGATADAWSMALSVLGPAGVASVRVPPDVQYCFATATP